MTTLNNWSHGLYYYIAACAHVERYRELRTIDPEEAVSLAVQMSIICMLNGNVKREQAMKAEKLFDIIPAHMGKKKIMGRQLPFDVFVQRKLDKWKQRAKENKLSLIDAVGISPICEMIYFWNGYKRMQHAELEHCLERIAWSEANGRIDWAKEAVDEKGIYNILRGCVLRHLGQTEAARRSLQEVIDLDRSQFKSGLRDNWVPPSAHYEFGVCCWTDFRMTGNEADLKASEKWLNVVAAWESYDLDTR